MAEKAIMAEQFYVVQPFASFGRGVKIHVIFYEDRIAFQAPGKDAPHAKLYYRHILEVLYGTKSEVVEVSKSMVGRYLIGQTIGGHVGGMAGILSAVQDGGKRSKQVTNRYLVIGYNGKSGKEELIALQTKSHTAGQKAEKLIREKTGKPPRE